jgi:hypothetical protein
MLGDFGTEHQAGELIVVDSFLVEVAQALKQLY